MIIWHVSILRDPRDVDERIMSGDTNGDQTLSLRFQTQPSHSPGSERVRGPLPCIALASL